MPKQMTKSAATTEKAAPAKTKKAAEKSKPVAANKVAAKGSAPAKSAPKKASSKAPAPAEKAASASKSNSKIPKSTPVKKTAKPSVNIAATKKLATSKKTASKPAATKAPAETKPAKPAKAKSSATKKAETKPVANNVISKPKARTTPAKSSKPFVMPKTSTQKARKYEPQFVKSVLDQAPEENNGPSMRYSDSELQEFRELITKKLDTAKKELGYLQGLITRKDEMGGDDTDNRYMTMEDGSLSMEREQLSQMASRQITFIDHLEKAMMRIENKTYGICRVTGKLIDKARLRAVPHATLSIEAKMGFNR